MNRMGEQGEHFGRFQILSPRVLAKDREAAPLLTLLTPASQPTSGDHQGGDLA
jgi:hypothetical protein